jgi:hypothetical protein
MTDHWSVVFFCLKAERLLFWLIGQNALVKTAVTIEISMAAAVLSFFDQLTGWTKRVSNKSFER